MVISYCGVAPILYIQLSVYTNVLMTFDTRGNSNKTAIRRDQPLTSVLSPHPLYPPMALKWKKRKQVVYLELEPQVTE